MAVVQSVLETLWRQSWQAAVVAGLVILLRWFLGRWIGPRWRDLLWMIVLAKLILPALPGSAISIFNLPQWVERVSGHWKSAPAIAPAPIVYSRTYTDIEETSSQFVPSVQRHPIQTTTFSPQERAQISLLTLWIIGALASIGRIVLVNRRFWRRVAASRREPDEQWINLLNDCRREMGMRRTVEIRVTDAVGSPALAGAIRPVILIPPGAMDQLTPSQIRLIFLHELAHLRCGDIWMDWLWSILMAIHWFNPILFFARSCARADRELARDAMVLRIIGPRLSGDYGEALITLVEHLSRRLTQPGVVAVVDSPGALRRRVTMIAKYDGRRLRFGWLALPAVLLIAGISLSSAQTKPVDQTSNPAPTTAPEPDPLIKVFLDRAIPDFNLERQVTLHEALNYLAEFAQINVDVEFDQLKGVLDPARPVAAMHLHDVTYSEILDAILPSGWREKVDLSLDRNVLTISTPQGLAEIATMKKDEDYSTADDADRKMLDRYLPTFVFPKVPFREAIKFIAEVSGAKIDIDSKALAAAGIDDKAPVTISGQNVPVSKLLDMTLRSAGAGKIEYVANDGTITISTIQTLDQMPIMRIYDLKDYMTSWPDKQKTTDEIANGIEAQVKSKMSWPDGAAIDVNSQQLVVTQTRGNQILVRTCLQQIHQTLGPVVNISARLLDVASAPASIKTMLENKLASADTAVLSSEEASSLEGDFEHIKVAYLPPVVYAPAISFLQEGDANLFEETMIPFVSGIIKPRGAPRSDTIYQPRISDAVDGLRTNLTLTSFTTSSAEFKIHIALSRFEGFTIKTIQEKDPTLHVQVANGSHADFDRSLTVAANQSLLIRLNLEPGCAVVESSSTSSTWTFPSGDVSTAPTDQSMYCIVRAKIFADLAAAGPEGVHVVRSQH